MANSLHWYIKISASALCVMALYTSEVQASPIAAYRQLEHVQVKVKYDQKFPAADVRKTLQQLFQTSYEKREYFIRSLRLSNPAPYINERMYRHFTDAIFKRGETALQNGDMVTARECFECLIEACQVTLRLRPTKDMTNLIQVCSTAPTSRQVGALKRTLIAYSKAHKAPRFENTLKNCQVIHEILSAQAKAYFKYHKPLSVSTVKNVEAEMEKLHHNIHQEFSADSEGIVFSHQPKKPSRC